MPGFRFCSLLLASFAALHEFLVFQFPGHQRCLQNQPTSLYRYQPGNGGKEAFREKIYSLHRPVHLASWMTFGCETVWHHLVQNPSRVSKPPSKQDQKRYGGSRYPPKMRGASPLMTPFPLGVQICRLEEGVASC